LQVDACFKTAAQAAVFIWGEFPVASHSRLVYKLSCSTISNKPCGGNMANRTILRAILAVSILVILGVPGVMAAPMQAPKAQAAATCTFVDGFDAWPDPPTPVLPPAVPPGWTIINKSNPLGDDTWSQGESARFPDIHGALGGYGRVDSYSTGTDASGFVGTISNWLISPEIPLINGQVVEFYTRTADPVFPDNPALIYPDRLQVRVSVSGPSLNVGAGEFDTGDFITLLKDINPTYGKSGYPQRIGEYPLTWTAYRIPLKNLPPQATGRLAFRYFVENGGPSGVNSFYIGIDQVSVCSPQVFIPLVAR
jgi:hypothetical protein